jgi:8-oxo-dGTP pyrophosphatase MutT (NUDIX family)
VSVTARPAVEPFGRFRVVPAAYVLLRREVDGAEQVLLQLRQNTGYRDGYWASAAAGHVESGESVLTTAVREAAEELGVTIDPADLVPLTAMHRTQGNGAPIDERVDFFFECRRWSGEPARLEPHKSAALEWFALGALPDPVPPHELAVLTALREGSLSPVLTHGFDQPNSSG